MTDRELRMAHYILWRAWRGVSGNLAEATAWAALTSGGFDAEAAGKALAALVSRGDLAMRYNRDLPWYMMMRDDLGFAAVKR